LRRIQEGSQRGIVQQQIIIFSTYTVKHGLEYSRKTKREALSLSQLKKDGRKDPNKTTANDYVPLLIYPLYRYNHRPDFTDF